MTPTPADLAAEAKRLANEIWAMPNGTCSPMLVELEDTVDALLAAATREPEGKMDQAVATCASGVAEGWRLVPIDPTKLMLVKGENALHRASHGDFVATEGELEAFWHAMLAAAPVASERDSMVPSPSAQPAEPKERKPLTRNQCDGCCRGLPLDGNIHRNSEGHAVMTCQADRYAAAEPAEMEDIEQAWIDGEFQPQVLGRYEMFVNGWLAAEEHHGIQEQPKESK